MAKRFTIDPDADVPEDDLTPPPSQAKNLMTPQGHAVLKEELRWLLKDERPKICEIVSWAAGNGDRSENGDYIYNKKRLREIDARVRYLTKKLETAEIVDPKKQQGVAQIFFGATVTYVRDNESEQTVHLVGVDEADLDKGKINWQSPIGRALLKKRVGDEVTMRLDNKETILEILNVQYIAD